jgi:hypothetical protein
VRWGDELDVRRLDAHERREVAGYLAKYATKSTEQAGGLLHPIERDEVETAPVREHVRRYLRAAFRLHDACEAADKRRAAAEPARPQRTPSAAETARVPNLLARRAAQATSYRVRLRDGSEHVGRITRWAPARTRPS